VPGASRIAKSGHQWSHELDVTGLRFRLTKSAREALEYRIGKRGPIKGMRVERELGNEHDPNAIRVCLPETMLDGKHIGYLRAVSALVLAPRLDKGEVEIVRAQLNEVYAPSFEEGKLLVTFRTRPEPAKNRAAKPKTAKSK
jgi:hypothetical protein